LFPVFRCGGNIEIETVSESDRYLIAEFNARRSEEAFAALVRHHVDLVFTTALRQVGDRGAAEEITQNVFVALAQAADKLQSHPTIAGWLHQTALNKSREWIRSELRRHRREYVAVTLELAREEGASAWLPLVPLLDEALLKLRESDREAVILHFMEGHSFHDVGSALGVGEDAARKRVHRSLNQLTDFFRRRGFAVPALAVSTFSLHAAPAELGASATMAGLAAHSTVSISTLTLIQETLKIMAWTKAKTITVIGVAIIIAAGTASLVVKHQRRAGEPILQQSWTFRGYATPESTVESFFSAASKGDINALSECYTPERKIQFTQTDGRTKSESELARDAARYKPFADMFGDFWVNRKEMISSDELILHVRSSRLGMQSVPMKKIGNEWKINGYVQSENPHSLH